MAKAETKTGAKERKTPTRLTPVQLVPTAKLCVGDGDQFAVLVRTGSQTEQLKPHDANARASLLEEAAKEVRHTAARAALANNDNNAPAQAPSE